MLVPWRRNYIRIYKQGKLLKFMMKFNVELSDRQDKKKKKRKQHQSVQERPNLPTLNSEGKNCKMHIPRRLNWVIFSMQFF